MLKTQDDVERFIKILNLLQRYLSKFIFESNAEDIETLPGDDGTFVAAMKKYDYFNRLKKLYSLLLFWRKAITKKYPKMKGWPLYLEGANHFNQKVIFVMCLFIVISLSISL